MQTRRQTPELQCQSIGSQAHLANCWHGQNSVGPCFWWYSLHMWLYLSECMVVYTRAIQCHCQSIAVVPEVEGKPVSKFRSVLLHHFLTACAANSTFRLHAGCAFIQSAVLIVHGNRSYRKCNSPGNWNSDCTGITVGRLYFRFGDLRNRTSSPDQLEQLKQIGSIRGCYHDKKGRNQVRCMKPAPQSCFWIQPSKLHGPKLAQKGDVVQSRLNPLSRKFDERGDSLEKIVWIHSLGLKYWTILSIV